MRNQCNVPWDSIKGESVCMFLVCYWRVGSGNFGICAVDHFKLQRLQRNRATVKARPLKVLLFVRFSDHATERIPAHIERSFG